jgi:hypothetical protein
MLIFIELNFSAPTLSNTFKADADKSAGFIFIRNSKLPINCIKTKARIARGAPIITRNLSNLDFSLLGSFSIRYCFISNTSFTAISILLCLF